MLHDLTKCCLRLSRTSQIKREGEEDESQFKWFYVYFMFPFYVLIFVLFHGCRLYGSLYQLFHETERYHSGTFVEERLYLGGLDPACVDLDKSGRLIKMRILRNVCVRSIMQSGHFSESLGFCPLLSSFT